jgi:hypothetical protein
MKRGKSFIDHLIGVSPSDQIKSTSDLFTSIKYKEKSVDKEVTDDAKETFLNLGKEIRQRLGDGLVEDTSGLLNEYVNLYDVIQGK